MIRKDREIVDPNLICKIIDNCKVFRLGLSVENIPYIVPLNFGYVYKENNFEFCFHCANKGKKLDMIQKNKNVCFEMDCDHELTPEELACDYGYNFQSVMGTGLVEIVEDKDSKKDLLSVLMKHQTNKFFTFTDEQVSSVTVCKIKVSSITAKKRQV